MFGVVPAATQQDRAGTSTTSPPRERRNRTAFKWPLPSGTASSGSRFSTKETPSSRALMISSWFKRYAGESSIARR